MPTMYEIYERHSFEYDELVSCEDWQRNLPKELDKLFDFTGKSVIEFGVGTGRVTSLYIDRAQKVECFDRSQHMIDRAKTNLKIFEHKLNFRLCDNLEINTITSNADCVIEGWSFGHTVGDKFDEIESVVQNIVKNCLDLLNDKGSLIFIESLGSNTLLPAAPSIKTKKFYELLEGRFGFRKTVVRTDYKFDSVEEAARIFAFFFGEEISKGIKDKGQNIIPEFTGIWIKRKS